MDARTRWSLVGMLSLCLAGCLNPLPPPPDQTQPALPPDQTPDCLEGGVCETPPPRAPEPVCVADNITGGALPLVVTLDTTAAPVATDGGTCGDHAAGPVQTVEWAAPVSGTFALTATADFPVVMQIRADDCNGGQLTCVLGSASSPSIASLATVPMVRGESIAIELAGVGGAAGSVTFQITRNPDSCGDNVCEAEEDSNSCPADCTSVTDPGGGGGDTGGGIDTGGGGGIDTGGGGDDGGGIDDGGGDDGGGDDGGGVDDGGGDDGGDCCDDDGGGDDGGDDGDDGDAIRAPHHAPAKHRVPAPTPNPVTR